MTIKLKKCLNRLKVILENLICWSIIVIRLLEKFLVFGVGLSQMGDKTLFKLVPASSIPENAFKNRNDWTQFISSDSGCNFIALLTAEQVPAAAAASFAGRDDILLLSYDVEKMIEEADIKIKHEAAETESGGSGPWVHAYGGAIPFACLTGAPAKISLSEDGKHVLPPLTVEDIAAAEAEKLGHGEIDSDAHSSDDDGLAQFDQHTYDLDDDGNDALDPS